MDGRTMSLRWKLRTPDRVLWIALCAVAFEGCASWQGPRIDPSGQRILIWPGDTPAAVAPAPPVAPPPAFAVPPVAPPAGPPPIVTTPTPPPPPPTVGLPTGNMQAPPVYPDAGIPTAPPPVITVPPGTPPAGPPPAAPPITTVPTAAAPVALPPPPTIDAQFAFPAPTIAQAGHPLVLTTIVTRRTDRAPLAGWTVRYEVAKPVIGDVPAGVNQVEVATDATGRSSIEISPTTTGSGEAIVTVAVVAPPDAAGPSATTNEVGRNVTRITWKPNVPGAPPWLPAPSAGALAMSPLATSGPAMEAPSLTDSPPPPPSTPPPYGSDRQPNRFEPPPSLSNDKSPPKTYGPPPKLDTAAKPELVVDVRLVGPEQVAIGGYASFNVTVTNRGDAAARKIKLLARFDPGLSHVRAEANELAVKYEGMRDLMPGESASVPLTYGVRAAGRQCHHVSVTAEDAAEATGTGCITAIESKPKELSALEVTKLGPTRHYVGEIAKFRVVIKNTGDEPVQNIVILDHYDDAIEPRRADSGREILEDGTLRWTVPLLGVGEKRVFNVESACVSPAESACSRVTVTADGGLTYAEEKCVEIMLPLAPPPAGGAQATTPPPPVPAEGLQLSLRTSANPARVGTPLSLYIFVENLGQQVQRGVSVRVQLPKGATPDSSRIVPPGAFEMIGQMEVRFANVGDIGPGERRDFEIPLTSNAPGVVTFTAQVSATGMDQPIVKESDPLQIEAAAQ